ncbi:MAG: hypothetical protein H6605_03115 [Flavobacteriales bacterium]|nr:hypothetical protein [Flavobacteriales bacterium]
MGLVNFGNLNPYTQMNVQKNRTNFNYIHLVVYVVLWSGITGCSKSSDPITTNSNNDFVTTIRLELRDSASGVQFNYYYRNPEGTKGNMPLQWDSMLLDTQRTYYTTVFYLNESNPNAIVNINTRILNNKKDYLICYNDSATGIDVIPVDTDDNYPIGISTKWYTKNTAVGNIDILLKHQPGIKNGDCSPGEIEESIRFNLKIR